MLDDNLLATSDEHIRSVFAMLSKQDHPVEFTGGLEAARLRSWHVEALHSLRPEQLFFAYDTADDLEPLRQAGQMLLAGGFKAHPHSHALRCFVLIGYPHDTLNAATERMHNCLDAGFTPMAMLYRDKAGETDREWRRFQREWARPAMIHARSAL